MRVLIADDHGLVREGLRLIIESQRDVEMQVVGEAVDGEEALRLTRQLRPDVVIMDVSMPQMNGVRATECIQASYPQIKVLGVSAYRDEGHIRQMRQAGASGYVLKKAASQELIQAIQTVMRGELYFDDCPAGSLAEETPNPQAHLNSEAGLSPREREVLMDVALGCTNLEIAEKMQVSVKTIEGHKAKIGIKMGLKTRAAIVRYALHRGWLNEE